MSSSNTEDGTRTSLVQTFQSNNQGNSTDSKKIHVKEFNLGFNLHSSFQNTIFVWHANNTYR